MRALKLGLALGVLGTAATAGATTTTAYDLDDLAVRSARIVTGTVVDLESRWEGNVVVTAVHVAVDECLKGACGDRLVEVRVLGGRVDDLEMRVEGMARFDVDERVLLFLEPAEGPRLRPTGMAQGKFRLVETAADPVAVRDLDGLRLVGPDAESAGAFQLADLRSLVARIDAALVP
jgi:hypothetical protein